MHPNMQAITSRIWNLTAILGKSESAKKRVNCGSELHAS
jgi:hypothetical protein